MTPWILGVDTVRVALSTAIEPVFLLLVLQVILDIRRKIILLRDGYSKAIPSVSAIVNAASLSDIDLWWHAETPLPLSATPPFFQHLINTMLTDVQCQDIASEL